MTDNQWLSFSVDGEMYAHAIESVKEIITYSDPTPVPGAPEYIEGILNVRGVIVPTLSTRLLLGLEPQADCKDAKIIIFEKESSLIGISVDTVEEINHFDLSKAEWSNTKAENQLIEGTIHHDGQLYILSDFMALQSDVDK